MLAVRFHLRMTRPEHRRLHRLFQRICVVTTPFFAGLDGYRTKLWMYDPRSGDYAGLYEWDGAERAERYARALVPILSALSNGGSVSYRVYPGHPLDAHLVQGDTEATGPSPADEHWLNGPLGPRDPRPSTACDAARRRPEPGGPAPGRRGPRGAAARRV